MVVTSLKSSFHPVPKVISKAKKSKCKEIKKKSKRLSKLEKQRDKDLIKEGNCEFCGNYSKQLDPHEIFGGCNRVRSIKNKFMKLLCRECHSSEEIINQLRIDTQKEYEKTHTRQEFIDLIGKNYIRRNENEI